MAKVKSKLIINQKIPKIVKSKRVILGIIVLVAILIIGTWGGSDPDKIITTQVERKSITSEIVASGKISSVSETTIHSAVNGKVVWVGVKKGDYVTRGQAIASLDKEKFEIALRQAEQDVNQTDAVLSQVYDDLKKFSPPENFDQKIKRTNAETAKNKAYDAMKKAQRDLKDTIITSPISGTVIELNVHPGDEILYTTDISKVADLENLNFTAELDDTDIGKIQEKQKAIIALDAFPENEVDSNVEFINFISSTSSTGTDVFEVKLYLEPFDEYRIGMNGETRIIIHEKDDVLVVPIEALFEDNFVWTIVNGNYVKREVQKGIESDSEIEIISGLSINEVVATAGFEEIGKKNLIQKIFSIFSK